MASLRAPNRSTELIVFLMGCLAEVGKTRNRVEMADAERELVDVIADELVKDLFETALRVVLDKHPSPETLECLDAAMESVTRSSSETGLDQLFRAFEAAELPPTTIYAAGTQLDVRLAQLRPQLLARLRDAG